ncbi:MAG: hypothetical protein SGILL_010754, partial [Bacillariaceae sp.]
SLPTALPLQQHQRNEPSPGIASLDQSSRIQMSASNQGDDLSVGNSTISTLSSTESVFDRLYRTNIRSPRAPPRYSASNDKAKSKLVSPITTKPRVKNRLEAYEAKSLGGSEITGDRTPKRGGTARNLFTDEEGATDSLSASSSVYARLYRNEKRPEKLWTKPPAFTPKLSNTRHHHETETALHDLDIYSPHPAAQQDAEIPNDASLSSHIPIIDTTLEQDLEEIQRLGRILGTTLHDSSPTVTSTSVSSNVTPTTSTHFNLAAAAASMDPAVDEEFSMLEAVGKQLDRMELDQARFSDVAVQEHASSHIEPMQS